MYQHHFPAPRQEFLMGKGFFSLSRFWTDDSAVVIELWTSDNGAVLRRLMQDVTSAYFYPTTGHALRYLRKAGFPLPEAPTPAYAEELTPIGPQLVIPGCERRPVANGKPAQLNLFG